jgi:ABC-2 type transport system ATP-binding protein
MSIEVQNVSKKYGSQRVLNQVSFKLHPGEIVGFLGPNGAGKSTLMKIITTFIKKNEGEVIVNGYDVDNEPMAVKRSVGYLPEHNPLYLEMYVREYLEFNASIYSTNIDRINEVIKLVGLMTESHKKIGQLSKGYRQRVGLAAALLHDPEVLILDEPTTGLDPNQLVEIRNLIKKIGETKTVLLSTHIMQEVEALCDRVIIINKGEIVANKTLDELTDNKNQIIVVEFDKPITKILLEKIPNISKYKKVQGNIWNLSFSTKKDMRSSLFDFASQNGFKLLQSHQEKEDLETLFRNLTKN